eukprot:14403-Heterococcus_DN1.PRE.1
MPVIAVITDVHYRLARAVTGAAYSTVAYVGSYSSALLLSTAALALHIHQCNVACDIQTAVAVGMQASGFVC